MLKIVVSDISMNKKGLIMEVENSKIISPKNRKELRQWFELNGQSESYCWLVVSMREKQDTVLYLDAVEEAICFGWIDSTRKKLDDGRLVQRLSHRLRSGNWTELNKERARRLERLGLMTDEGRKYLPQDIATRSFEIHPNVMAALKKDSEVYKNFMNFPELYRIVRIDTIQSRIKRNETEIFQKRLEKFIKYTKANKMYGDWNDNGRLINHLNEAVGVINSKT